METQVLAQDLGASPDQYLAFAQGAASFRAGNWEKNIAAKIGDVETRALIRTTRSHLSQRLRGVGPDATRVFLAAPISSMKRTRLLRL